MTTNDLYKQIIHWLAEEHREDWHEVVKKIVTPEMFDSPDYQKVFRCLAGNRDVLDHNLSEDQINILLDAMLMDSYKPLNEKAMVDHLHEIERVQNREKLKSVLARANTALDEGMEGIKIAHALGEIKKLSSLNPGKSIQDIQKEIDAGVYEKVSPKTGIRLFDDCIEGFHKGHIWIIGAYAGAGKSLMCTKLAYNVAKQGAEVLFLTLEMSDVEVTRRLNKDAFDDGNKIDDLPVTIYKDMSTLSEIESAIRRHKPHVVFIDFIQLVRNDEKTEYAQMTKNALELQRMARELDVCIVCASQFSNDYAKMQSLQTLNYKGSGAIAQVADMGIILHRDIDKEDEAEIVPLYLFVRKNRHGKGGRTKIEFNTKHGRIIDRDFVL